MLVSALCSVSSQHWILGQFKVRLVFLLQSTIVRPFSGIHGEIFFRLFSLRTKQNFSTKLLPFFSSVLYLYLSVNRSGCPAAGNVV